VLDFDDGHRLTKGHPGAVIIPASLAVAQLVDAPVDELLTAIIVGYEVAIRAGIALHGRDSSYHASGAWGGVGAAAAAARLLELDPSRTVAAIGLAEYHAPIAPIMRSCADPAMTKDACAWGASIGVQSAQLAARGFTSVRPEFLEPSPCDLGERWRLEELYVKAFPCCRWSQGAIAAALRARDDRRFEAEAVRRIRIHTFAAAAGLADTIPTTTEEAQYNLAWPVACALTRGSFTVADVLGPFDDRSLERLFENIEIDVDPALTTAFPARRLTTLELELAGGASITVGPLEAPGEPDDPSLAAIVADKVQALIDPQHVATPAPGAGARSLDAAQLLGWLCNPTPAAALA
jgi:2-methylcitrate dehydratase PrpD